MNGYDAWLTTTPEDEADAARERAARREAAAIARAEAEPEELREQTFPCMVWNPVTKRAEPGTFKAHPADYEYDPMRGKEP